jgi:hypothetical protein
MVGCTGDARPELRLAGGQATGLVVPEALEAAGEQFLGPDFASAGLGIGGRGGPGFDRRLLRPDATTPFRQTSSQTVTVGLSWPVVLAQDGHGGTVELVPSLGLGVARLGYVLPDGIGILVDPMTVNIQSLHLTPEVALRYRPGVRLPGDLRIEAFAGTGVHMAQSRTQLRSALIALDGKSRQSLPYLTAGTVLRRDMLGMTLAVSARRKGPVTHHLGLEYRFRP